MAFNRYKGTHLFDRSTPSDAGSTILKLTNKILADLQVDNISSQNDTQGVVRTSRSFSDPAGGANTPQRGPHPAYYDPNVILQPAKNPNLVSAPISASDDLKDFDPLHSHSLPTTQISDDNWLSPADNTTQETKATHVTSELSKYLSEDGKVSNEDDEFWTFFDGEKQQQSQTATPCHDDSDDIVANGNHDALQAATVSPDETKNSVPQLQDMELSNANADQKNLEDEKDITIELSSPASVHYTEENMSDDEDEQLTGNIHSTLMTKSNCKPFVARFIKLSPFKCIDPELPRVKIIIVGDANTGKSCFLHKYIHGCFDYQSQPTVGVDICTLPLEDKKTGKRLVAQLWDTQGQERFNALTTGYFRGAHGAILVYDITNYKSLNSIYSWKAEVEKVTSINPFTHIPTVLVGNKLDLAAHHETHNAKDVADKLDIDCCFEASSKDGRGIDEVVDFLLEEILRRNLLESLGEQQPTERVSLGNIDNDLDKKKCCKS